MLPYSINNINDAIEYDLPLIFNEIDSLYTIHFDKQGSIYTSKIILNSHWASKESTDAYNKLVPRVKRLVKEIYCNIEILYKSKTGEFDRVTACEKYKYLNELRLLNNKLKHFNNTKDTEIELLPLSFLSSTNHIHSLEFSCTFKHKGKLSFTTVADFIDMFLNVLADLRIISITRNENRTVRRSFEV